MYVPFTAYNHSHLTMLSFPIFPHPLPSSSSFAFLAFLASLSFLSSPSYFPNIYPTY
jgi:hypothetical protein